MSLNLPSLNYHLPEIARGAAVLIEQEEASKHSFEYN